MRRMELLRQLASLIPRARLVTTEGMVDGERTGLSVMGVRVDRFIHIKGSRMGIGTPGKRAWFVLRRDGTFDMARAARETRALAKRRRKDGGVYISPSDGL